MVIQDMYILPSYSTSEGIQVLNLPTSVLNSYMYMYMYM